MFPRASGSTTHSDIGLARAGPSAEFIACVVLKSDHSGLISCIRNEARHGEELDVDPHHQFQDSNNGYDLFAGATYEADDEGADKIYEQYG